MRTYLEKLKLAAKEYRKKGKTYLEINEILGEKISKSTYSYWFRDITLTKEQRERITGINKDKLDFARKNAVFVNKVRRDKFLNGLNDANAQVAKRTKDLGVAKIALAMLCLGEASKSKSSSGFYLGNSDPKIVVIFMQLLMRCFSVNKSKFRFTIQCRADQDITDLENYWRRVVGVDSGQFYKSRIDPRTVGKPTKDKSYRGVLRVDCTDRKIQLDLESLAEMIYNRVC